MRKVPGWVLILLVIINFAIAYQFPILPCNINSYDFWSSGFCTLTEAYSNNPLLMLILPFIFALLEIVVFYIFFSFIRFGKAYS